MQEIRYRTIPHGWAFWPHLRDAVFVFADEAFFAGDKAHEGVLKALVVNAGVKGNQCAGVKGSQW